MAYFTLMALKTTVGYEQCNKYLRVITDDIKNQDYLEYSAEEVVNPNAKFAVEYAHDGLVHIRSCRTNKYWVRSPNDGRNWIVAKASKPTDDRASWGCTLFRMDYNSNENTATFYHVQSETVVCLRYDGSDRDMFLSIDPLTAVEAISTVVDFDTFQLLPKYFALKSDNDKFFDYSTRSFASEDYGRDSVVNEIRTTRDGYIRIRKKGYPEDYGWTYISPDTIVMDSNPGDSRRVLFEVVRVKDGVVALRNLENGKFCVRGTPYVVVVPDYLSVSATSIVKEAQFQVVETVLSRRVQVLEFDLDSSRIYNLTPINSDTHRYDNYTDKEQEASMNLTISTTKTTTWKNSFSASVGVETSFTAGIPLIVEGEITVSAEATYEHGFGGSTKETQEIGDTFTVKVPPFKRVTGKGMATKGTCDVPFTYYQVDLLTDGSKIRTTLSDGVFTGVNAYDFYHDVHYEDIPPKELIKLKSSHPTSTD